MIENKTEKSPIRELDFIDFILSIGADDAIIAGRAKRKEIPIPT